MIERVDVEVGVELPVHHSQDVLVELGCDALGIVVGRFEAVDGFDEVGAEKEEVVRPEHRGNVAQEHRPGLGQEIADRAAEEHDEAPTAVRDVVEIEA